MLCYALLRFALLFLAMLCHALPLLHFALLFLAMLCHALLRCALLRFLLRFLLCFAMLRLASLCLFFARGKPARYKLARVEPAQSKPLGPARFPGACWSQGATQPVPWSQVMTAGFPCTSRSKANNARAKNAACITEGTGETGKGCRWMLDAVKRIRPELLIMENVATLADGELGKTDLDVISARLAELDYWCWWRVFDAEAYGSPAARTRVYGMAVHARSDSSGKLRNLAFLLMAGTRMNHSPFSLGLFVEVDDNRRKKLMQTPAFASARDSKVQEKDFKWRDEHNEFYRMMFESPARAVQQKRRFSGGAKPGVRI